MSKTTFVTFHLLLQLVNVIFSRTSSIFFLRDNKTFFSNNWIQWFLNMLKCVHEITFVKLCKHIIINQDMLYDLYEWGKYQTNITSIVLLINKDITKQVIWERGTMLQTPHWLKWGAPHLPPPHPNYPFPWTDHTQTELPASSRKPSDLPSQTTSICDQPFCHSVLDRHTHTQTNR